MNKILALMQKKKQPIKICLQFFSKEQKKINFQFRNKLKNYLFNFFFIIIVIIIIIIVIIIIIIIIKIIVFDKF